MIYAGFPYSFGLGLQVMFQLSSFEPLPKKDAGAGVP